MQKLFYGGDILTMRDERDAPEAVLVDEGRIVYVGAQEAARRLAGEEAELVDLKGNTLMPSFIDPHSHIAMYAQFSSFADLSECESFDDILDVLRAWLKAHPVSEDGAVMAHGYDHNFLREGAHPTADVLDQVSDRIPICLFHTSGHMAVANTPLLAACGITRDTREPKSGRIGRYADGTPNGYLEELEVMTPVLMTVFSRMNMDPVRQMAEVQDVYLKYGITTAQDGGATPESVEDFLKMADSGLFKIDVVAYVLSDEKGIGPLLAAHPEAAGAYTNRFQIGGAKIILDGSPQGRTAWLSSPYEGEEEYRGYPTHPDEVVEGAARAAIKGNYQLLAHCNGDAAADQYLRCYRKALEKARDSREDQRMSVIECQPIGSARKAEMPGEDLRASVIQCQPIGSARKAEMPGEDLRPVMIHCQTVRDDQLDEMKEIGMIPSMFVAHTYYWGDVHGKNLGWERAARISPVRSALDRGLPYNFHQDCPVLKPDMMQTVWCAVNRRTKKGVKLGEEQCISAFDALKGVTINAAYMYHEEARKGTLEAGKLADLVLLDRNPLKVDPMEIRDITVLETIKEGVTLYRRE